MSLKTKNLSIVNVHVNIKNLHLQVLMVLCGGMSKKLHKLQVVKFAKNDLQGEHYAISEKRQKNEQHLCLVTYTFTKLSQNVCLIITQVLMYINARCD